MNQEKKMPKGKPKLDFKIAGRIFAYMKPDRGKLILVVICILLSSVVSAVSSLFLGSLIDNYILPLAVFAKLLYTTAKPSCKRRKRTGRSGKR